MVRWSVMDSFRAQVAVIALASISLTALAILLVRDILASAEQTLVRDAQQQCLTAAGELSQQFLERAQSREEPLEALPLAAQDVSLRGLAAAVLRSFDGVTGGFVLESDRLLGAASYAGDPAALSAGEARLVRALAARAIAEGAGAADRAAVGPDHIVAAAVPMRAGAAAWAVRRLRAPEPRSRRWWLAGLVTSALLGLGGIISISIRLRRGVATVRQGLGKLEEDFHYRLPAVAGDFGSIARAINHMAERRSALETYLRRQDRLAALGKVVAGVAHEIRNPLNSMRLTLELLDRRARKGAVMGDEVAGAIEEVDRLDGILARLLAFGRPGQERRIRQDVRPLIERAVRVVQQQAQAREVALRVETGCAALEAPVDGPQIEQVLINLLLNAIEASPPGGVVSVAAEPREREVRISVRDQGSGISDAVAEHVFDPYFTTKEAGNGLGLAVSREVVLHHAGQLEFQTGPRGTTFVVRLPAGAAS